MDVTTCSQDFPGNVPMIFLFLIPIPSARSTSSSVGALAGVWGGLALILRQLIRWVRIPFKSTVFRWFYPLVN